MPRTIADQKRSAKARQHRRRPALADQMVAPGDAMGAGHVAELLGLVRACKGLKISDVLPLSPSGVRVRDVGGTTRLPGGVPPGCETGRRRVTYAAWWQGEAWEPEGAASSVLLDPENMP
jgi:hypothetical protein